MSLSLPFAIFCKDYIVHFILYAIFNKLLHLFFLVNFCKDQLYILACHFNKRFTCFYLLTFCKLPVCKGEDVGNPSKGLFILWLVRATFGGHFCSVLSAIKNEQYIRRFLREINFILSFLTENIRTYFHRKVMNITIPLFLR